MPCVDKSLFSVRHMRPRDETRIVNSSWLCSSEGGSWFEAKELTPRSPPPRQTSASSTPVDATLSAVSKMRNASSLALIWLSLRLIGLRLIGRLARHELDHHRRDGILRR